MVGVIVLATAGNLVGIVVSAAGNKVGALVAFSSTVALVGTTLRLGAEVACPETGGGVLKLVVGAVVLGLEVIYADVIMLGALVAFFASRGQLGAVVGTIVSFAGAVSSVGSNADDGTLVA